MTTNRDAGERASRERERRQKERATPAWATEPNSRRALATALISVGGSMAAVLALIVVVMSGVLTPLFEPAPPTPTEPPEPTPTRAPIPGLSPPAATPLASPPAEPAGDGTLAVIETELGEIVIELFTDSAPVAAQNFINLAEAGFYDDVIFHRVVPGFVIQGGDPTGTGRGGPGYSIPADPVVGEFVRGTVAMAHSGDPDSGGSQFFIMLGEAPHLTALGHAIFGSVVEGMDVVDQIAAQPLSGERPIDPVEMIRVTIE
jgi:cyclophilin family peptidyl-prolyl cis-trans isomerase